MKKLVAIAAIAALSAISAFGQGQIVFGNTGAGTFKLKVTNGTITQTVGTASTMLTTGSTRIVLLVGNTGDAISSMVPVTAVSPPSTVVTNGTATLATVQGTFSGGTPTFSLGWDTSAKPTIQFAYVAWDIASGITSYLDLFSGNTFTGAGANFAGFSGIITGYAPGFGTTAAGQTFGAGANQISQLVLVQVPEPSTFVLAGLGAAAMMIFRRRK